MCQINQNGQFISINEFGNILLLNQLNLNLFSIISLAPKLKLILILVIQHLITLPKNHGYQGC